jgi:membrane-bound lytic murein transglycosylase MltF
MILNQKQLDIKKKIETISKLFDIDPSWATAIAMTESSLGMAQKSPTGCRGVFQMSLIAMKDILQLMQESDDDLVDIVCGIAFLRLLLRRWKSIDEATNHFCDPNDRDFYLARVKKYMENING